MYDRGPTIRSTNMRQNSIDSQYSIIFIKSFVLIIADTNYFVIAQLRTFFRTYMMSLGKYMHMEWGSILKYVFFFFNSFTHIINDSKKRLICVFSRTVLESGWMNKE